MLEALIKESPVIDQTHHKPLLDDIEGVCEKANIPPQFLFKSMKGYCSETEMQWVANSKTNPRHGLMYIGDFSISVETRMMLMVAAFLRNYRDARFITLHDCLQRLEEGTMAMPSVLVIPNFYLDPSVTGKIPGWKISQLYSYLLKRLAANLKTVIYIHSAKGLIEHYGPMFGDYVSNNYDEFIE